MLQIFVCLRLFFITLPNRRVFTRLHKVTLNGRNNKEE